MIAKGNQRGGGQNLASHLLNELDNERVEVMDVRGAVARDLHGAFAEWYAVSKLTKCRKYLYSLSISPDQNQKRLTKDQYLDFIERAERKLQLSGQARAIVTHVKDGREHVHVVWSRIDPTAMKAVQISHDRQKLRMVVRSFARDHGLDLPDGLKRDKGKNRHQDRHRESNLAEKQQEERTGITKEERQNDIAAAWRDSRSGGEFLQKLQEKGYYIAQGSRRDYVLVDMFGEVHSLSRQLAPAYRKDMRERLSEFPPDKLPSVDMAKERARLWREERMKKLQRQIDLPEQLRDDLNREHARRRRALDGKRSALMEQHERERAALEEIHKEQNRAIEERRREREPRGLMKFLGRVTGVNLLIARKREKQDRLRAEIQQAERDNLGRRHVRELIAFERHYRALSRVEKRERHALEVAIRRNDMQRAVSEPARAMPSPSREFNERARPEVAEHSIHEPPPKTPEPVADTWKDRIAQRQAERESIKEPFNEAAVGKEAQDKDKDKNKGRIQRLGDIFRDRAEATSKNDPLSRHFEEATEKGKPANDLAEILKRKRRNRDRDFER